MYYDVLIETLRRCEEYYSYKYDLMCSAVDAIKELERKNKSLSDSLNKSKALVDKLQANSMRHGRWVESDFSMGYKTICSECNYRASDRYVDEFEYCPRCGAKMDKDIIIGNEE